MATTDAAAGSCEDGVGGKIRRRQPRKVTTPYDRPSTALRNPSATGWLSKLVDRGSRIISNSAASLFSWVFRKRLVAASSEMKLERRRDLLKDTCITPSGINEKGSTKGENPSNISYDKGIIELGQLLNQKTFTRVAFDHLSELLRSRTVDLSVGNENKRTEPSTSQGTTTHVKQEKVAISAQANRVGSLRLFGSNSTPSIGTSVLEEEVGSPVELAKAYMSTRRSKVSPSSLHLVNQTFRNDETLLTIVPSSLKSPHMSFATRSSDFLSGVSGLSENGYLTPTRRGRSVVYRMGADPTNDGYAGPFTSSQWRANKMLSSGKQALKRRSSVLGDDFGSVGPIRRIRQKFSMISPKDRSLNSVPLLPVVSDSVHGSKSSIQKPHLLDEPKYISSNPWAVENGDNKISNASCPSVPPQSSEMARKILQQLDKLLPSPKEKSIELKLAMARKKSPSKLTLEMLNGRALKSMEDVESPKLLNAQDNKSLNGLISTHLLKPGNFISQNQDMVRENGSVMNADLGAKFASKAGGVESAIMSVEDSPSVMKHADLGVKSASEAGGVEDSPSVVKHVGSVVSDFTATLPQNKRAFQMSATEDSLENDDDDVYSSNNAFNSLAAEKEKPDLSLQECKTVFSETVIANNPSAPSPESKPATNFILNKEADLTAKVTNGPHFTGKDVGFTFPIAPAPSTVNPHPLLTTQSPSLPNPLVLPKEQASVPLFSFGSKSSNKDSINFTFSSTTSKVNDALGLNFGAGSDYKPEILNSNVTNLVTSATPLEATAADKGDNTQKMGNFYRSLENDGSTGVSTSTTPNIFSFGASNSSQANGLPTSSAISVSATPTVLNSGSSTDPISSSSKAATSGSNIPSISLAVPASVPSVFKFESSASTGVASSNSVPPPPRASGLELTDSEPKTKQASFFNTSGPLMTSSSPSFTSTTSSIFGFTSSAPSSNMNFSSAANDSRNSTPFGATSGSIFGTQAAPAGSSFAPFTQTMPSQFGSSTSSPLFGLSGSSSFGSASSFGSTTDGAKLFGSGSGSGFGLSTSSSFSTGASSLSSSSSSFAPSSNTTFGSNSQPAASSIFSTGFGSASPATGFSFGASTTAAGSTPLTFGSSLGSSSGSSMFSFTLAAAVPATSSNALSPVGPVFGMSNSVGFGSTSPGNDQMNVEDSMAEDTVQGSMPVASPAFGQPANTPSSSNFVFGSPAITGGLSVFQFGAQQNPVTLQNPSPFSASGNLELPTGGSFSLGTGNVDKSNRKIVRVRKNRKK